VGLRNERRVLKARCSLPRNAPLEALRIFPILSDLSCPLALNLKAIDVHHAVHLLKDGGQQRRADYAKPNPQAICSGRPIASRRLSMRGAPIGSIGSSCQSTALGRNVLLPPRRSRPCALVDRPRPVDETQRINRFASRPASRDVVGTSGSGGDEAIPHKAQCPVSGRFRLFPGRPL
jgi:hypothetical protein